MIPIELDFEKEEKGNEEALNEIARVKQLIIDFLKENKGKAFTSQEIYDLSKIKSKKVCLYSELIYDPRDKVISDLKGTEHVESIYEKTIEGEYEEHFYYSNKPCGITTGPI